MRLRFTHDVKPCLSSELLIWEFNAGATSLIKEESFPGAALWRLPSHLSSLNPMLNLFQRPEDTWDYTLKELLLYTALGAVSFSGRMPSRRSRSEALASRTYIPSPGKFANY